MKSTFLNRLIFMSLAMLAATPLLAQENPAQFQARANARVAKALGYKSQWDGPTSGPAITKKNVVVMVGSDMRLPGISGLDASLKELSKSVGWQYLAFQTFGKVAQRPEAFSRALALKPSAIILAGIDAREVSKELQQAAKAKIPVIGWHAGPTPGAVEGLFTNVATDPREVGQVAALFSVVDSKGKAGVVVFTDSSDTYSVIKANTMIETVKQCQTCTLLGVEEIPFAAKPDKVKDILTGLVTRHGSRWTHVLATDDLHFNMMSTPAAQTILGTYKLQGISAGDGPPAAYQRIRSGALQIGTVPEPLKMHAHQLIDEVNRAVSKQAPSGYTTQAYLVTNQNNSFHGGPSNTFEPSNGYQSQYKKIWKK
jgi:ribose transport system substrate-binding protein